MTNPIHSYEDLLAEQVRLKDQLLLQKQQIRLDIREIKEELKPAMAVVSFIGKFTSPETRNGAIISAGSGLTIDWLAKKFLSKNILLRMFLPKLLKNASSHVLFDNVKPFISKLIKNKIAR